MSRTIILASGSQIRATMLADAGVVFDVQSPRVDEDSVKTALLSEAVKPRDIADALAEMKSVKVSMKRPDALVIGADQVLDLDGEILDKPETVEDARDQLKRLSGRTHKLHTAAVISEEGRPVWRKVAEVRLAMHPISDAYLDDYLARNWPAIGQSCGAYQLEREGARLFHRIDGDHFAVLGLPLLDVLGYLVIREAIPR